MATGAGAGPIPGNMMDEPLLVSGILRQAARLTPQAGIVSRLPGGGIHRYDYAGCAGRSARLATALGALGIRAGDRVGTLAWNGHRHLEIYYAASGIGAVVHTINPRLFAEQIQFVVEHAADRILFADPACAELLAGLAARMDALPPVVFLCDADQVPPGLPFAYRCYEDLIGNAVPLPAWPEFDERSAACLCYTSGTTGDPKGVLYSHRSTVLHALASCTPNALNLSRDTVVLPVVPMYHVSAWGIPYSGLMAGARLVLPGNALDGGSLCELIEAEGVNLMLGVPTVWFNLLQHLQATGRRLPPGIVVAVGGAAAPRALVDELRERHGCWLMPLWGMTETSPLATFGGRSRAIDALPDEEKARIQTSAGRPIHGVEIEIFDEDDRPLPHDGLASGALRVRGPWVLRRYYRAEADATAGGWFDTGDVATIDAQGYLRIVDRAKDVIKSGGEWISSIALENAALGHPQVAQAAVIGAPHPKWDERPLLIVVTREGQGLDRESLMHHLAGQVAKWWLPDAVVEVDGLPHTATGKLNKRPLRERFRGYFQGTAAQGD
ncbi:MAG: long-chain fatty acid--CoA ligase [Gammaproteobacteria bacterium]